MSRPTALDERSPIQLSPKLRVGLLVDGVETTKYVYELVRWAAGQDDLDFSHLLILQRPTRTFERRLTRTLKDGMDRCLSEVPFKLLVKFEQILIKRVPQHRDHLTTFRIDQLIGNQLQLTPLRSRSGLEYRFSADDIEAVRNLNVDLLIQCGRERLCGQILDAARLGIISFHHANSAIHPGGPVAFWETFYRSDATGFILQKLTEKLDGGAVLKRGAFTTQFFWLLNQAHLYKKSNEHLKDLLKSIAVSGDLPRPEEHVSYPARPHQTPQLHHILLYACKICWRIALKVGRRSIGLKERWSVSFIKAGWQAAVFRRAKRIPNPPGRFLADPFLHTRAGRTYCFVEDYVYRTSKGHISVYELRDNDAVQIGPCLIEPFHLSFPYLFNYQDRLYMCPETDAARQIRVYRSKEFPLEWELVSVLMADIRAADTMLFEHGGKWWMLTNIDKSEIGDHCAELYLFYADSPLSDRWTAHPLNPLYIDPEMARNAGLFMENGRLFRAAQRQGFDAYGTGFAIVEITTLSETQYVEERIAIVEPNFKRRLRGTHHISTTGSTTVIDHMSISFVR